MFFSLLGVVCFRLGNAFVHFIFWISERASCPSAVSFFELATCYPKQPKHRRPTTWKNTQWVTSDGWRSEVCLLMCLRAFEKRRQRWKPFTVRKCHLETKWAKRKSPQVGCHNLKLQQLRHRMLFIKSMSPSYNLNFTFRLSCLKTCSLPQC